MVNDCFVGFCVPTDTAFFILITASPAFPIQWKSPTGGIYTARHHLLSTGLCFRQAANDIGVSGVGDREGAHAEVFTAGRTQLNVVAVVMVHTGLGQHSIVLDLRFTTVTKEQLLIPSTSYLRDREFTPVGPFHFVEPCGFTGRVHSTYFRVSTSPTMITP